MCSCCIIYSIFLVHIKSKFSYLESISAIESVSIREPFT
nr:MAG TPA: hypothetical protein [Crassvirales sp.]